MTLVRARVTGSKMSRIVQQRHDQLDMHGLGAQWTRTDVERYFRHLVLRGVLTEDLVITAQDHTACYVRLGKKASDVLRGSMQVLFQLAGKQRADVTGTSAHDVTSSNDNPVWFAECCKQLLEVVKGIGECHCSRDGHA